MFYTETSSARAHLYSCAFAVVVMSGELDQAGGKERGRKHGSNNERAVGVEMSSPPPLLAAPAFD